MAILLHLQCSFSTVDAIITILFINFLCYSVKATSDANFNGGFSAHLIHKDSPHLPSHNHERSLMGRRRPHILQTRLIEEKKDCMRLMKLSIGTPAVELTLYADSGSHILWTKCQPCKSCNETYPANFDPRKSSSYRNITCSDKECNFIDEDDHLYNCTKPKQTCDYYVGYGDTSFSTGPLVKETVTLTSTSGKPVILKNIVMGCGTKISSGVGGAGSNKSDGIIGLGRGRASFVSQIAPFVGGKKFSYCLVSQRADPSITSTINFGKGSEVVGDGVVSTPLLNLTTVHYDVSALGITVANKFLPFNISTGQKGRMTVDSGSAATLLPQELYDGVVAELNKTLDPKLKLFTYFASNQTSLPCINTTMVPKGPSMTVHLDGGGKLQLSAEQLFHPPEPGSKLMCAVIANSTLPQMKMKAIYGAVLQENFLVGYDLDNMMISFKPTDCVKMSTSTTTTPSKKRNQEL